MEKIMQYFINYNYVTQKFVLEEISTYHFTISNNYGKNDIVKFEKFSRVINEIYGKKYYTLSNFNEKCFLDIIFEKYENLNNLINNLSNKGKISIIFHRFVDSIQTYDFIIKFQFLSAELENTYFVVEKLKE